MENNDFSSEERLHTIMREADKGAAPSCIDIYRRKDNYDLDPPYQRGNIWDQSWKTDLILSIWAGVTIAPIHCVRKHTDKPDLTVLDGKQRLNAILEFFDNKIKIPIRGKYFFYKEIKDAVKDNKSEIHDVADSIIERIESQSITIIKYRPCSWSDQISLFEKINHAKSLTKEELFFGKYAYLKLFLKHIKANYIAKWADAVNLNDLPKSKDYLWLFRLLGCVMGLNVTLPHPSFNKIIKSITKHKQADSTKFADEVNKKIKDYMDKDDYLFDYEDRVNKMLSDFGWEKVKDSFDSINVLASALPKKSKELWAQLFFTCFLLEQFSDKIITKSLFNQDIEKYKEMYKNYSEFVRSSSSNFDLAVRRCSTPAGLTYHKNELEKLWDPIHSDKGQKNVEPTKEERELALQRAGNKCEICGSQDNLQIDHVYGKQQSSLRVYGVLCQYHNIMKSNSTEAVHPEFLKYINKHKTDHTHY